MNERIWELKRQAMLFAQEKCDGQTTDMHGNLRSNIWTEKFAELIVRECLKFVEPDQTSGDEWCVTLDETAQSIKQHFGVRE
jgi:hypothetical protein